LLDRIGHWPHNRVVYAAADAAPPVLAALAAELKAALAQAGFRTEERPYVPHVTLIRDARRAPSERTMPPIRWRVDDYVLMQSRRGGSGSAYEVLHRFTLASRAAMLRASAKRASDWNTRRGS
jgi:2'-5' RNA ligase